MFACSLPAVSVLPLFVCALQLVCDLSPPPDCAILYVRTTIRAPTGINSGRICRLIKLIVVLPSVLFVSSRYLPCVLL